MLRDASVIDGFFLRAKGDVFGHVRDLLFDKSSWSLRWLVVETDPEQS